VAFLSLARIIELVERILSSLDHTFLKIDASAAIDKLRDGAVLVAEKGLRVFVSPPQLVKTKASRFPEIRVITVVGYPLGFETLGEKVFACQQAARDGAREVDVVLDLFALINGNLSKVRRELELLSATAKHARVGLKVIIETPILTEQRIVQVSNLINDFDLLAAKSSTGYGREPTELEHIRLLRDTLREDILVKASGGIRTLSDVRKFMEAGASIIGTSSTPSILGELERGGSSPHGGEAGAE